MHNAMKGKIAGFYHLCDASSCACYFAPFLSSCLELTTTKGRFTTELESPVMSRRARHGALLTFLTRAAQAPSSGTTQPRVPCVLP